MEGFGVGSDAALKLAKIKIYLRKCLFFGALFE